MTKHILSAIAAFLLASTAVKAQQANESNVAELIVTTIHLDMMPKDEFGIMLR